MGQVPYRLRYLARHMFGEVQSIGSRDIVLLRYCGYTKLEFALKSVGPSSSLLGEYKNGIYTKRHSMMVKKASVTTHSIV